MGRPGGRLLSASARWVLVARRFRAPSLTRIGRGASLSVLLVAGAAIAAFAFGARAGEMRDFEVYWTAAQRASAGEPLYRAADQHYQFKYLPAFAVLAAPLSNLTLDTAKAVWFSVSVGLLVTLIWLSLATLGGARKPRWLLTVAIVVAMGKFYGHELVLGQVNLLFAVLATAALLLIRRGRDAGAALLFVAAVVVKPYAVIFLPWLAWVRGRPVIAPAAIGIACVLALPAVLYGVRGAAGLHEAWWLTVTESTAPNLTNADNVSLAAFVAKWLGMGPGATALTALLSLALILAAAAVIRQGRDVPHREILEGVLLLMLVPLLSPQGWDYVFLVATPAIAVLVNHEDQLPGPLRTVTWIAILTIGLSLFDLMGRQRYAIFMSWSVITIAFLALVGSLAALRARRVA